MKRKKEQKSRRKKIPPVDVLHLAGIEPDPDHKILERNEDGLIVAEGRITWADAYRLAGVRK